MAHILYIGVPAQGHTHPSLAVLAELQQRGHHVTMLNTFSFAEQATAAGLDFVAYPALFPEAEAFKEAAQKMITAALLISKVAQPLADFLIAFLAGKQYELIIYDSLAMWGYIAARRLELPHLCFITTFVLEASLKTIGLKGILNYLWSSLPHMRHLLAWKRQMAKYYGKDTTGNTIAGSITEYAALNLVFSSKAFHPPSPLLDARFCFVGPALNPRLRNEPPLPAEALQPRQQARVYVALGTLFHDNTAFYRIMLAIARTRREQFLFAIGPHVHTEALAPIPSNCLLFRSVPQLKVLQHTALFISHGGLNSVQESLYYGVPLLVIPGQQEQLLNGRRVAQLGAGLCLEKGLGQISLEQVDKAITALLTDSHYRMKAEILGSGLKQAGGYQRAAELIEAKIELAPHSCH